MEVPLPGCGIHPQPGTLPKDPCCLPTNPVCPTCLSSTDSWSRGQPCHSASGFPTSAGVCCLKRDYPSWVYIDCHEHAKGNLSEKQVPAWEGFLENQRSGPPQGRQMHADHGVCASLLPSVSWSLVLFIPCILPRTCGKR